MKVIYSKYSIELALEENQVNSLIIENPIIMCEVVRDLMSQMKGENGDWILSEEDNMLPFLKNCVFIDNPFVINSNEKRILTKLYKELADQVKNLMYEEYMQLTSATFSFLEQLFTTVPYHLDMELEVDVSTMLKAYDVKLASDCVEPLEMLIDYLRAISSICGIRVVWLLNLKQFLSKEQMEQLYEFCFYEKIYLINIEGQQKYLLPQEKSVIIDEGLCLIELDTN